MAEFQHGNIYNGSTILQDQATAHFGDTYLSYYINTSSDVGAHGRPQPLTATDAITSLMTASKWALEVVNSTKASAVSIVEIQAELMSLRIIISGLESFINQTQAIATARTNLVPVQDVIAILTRLVTIFADLSDVLNQPPDDQRKAFGVPRVAAIRKLNDTVAARLLSQLQRYKTSLSLILQIITCGTLNEAQYNANVLRGRIDSELSRDADLAVRMRQLELPDNITTLISSNYDSETQIQNETARPDESIENATSGEVRHSMSLPTPRQSLNHESTIRESFNKVIARTRVYRRVQHLEVDHLSVISSTRSHGWSALSGINSSRLTCIGVIHLPLLPTELGKFRTFASSYSSDTSSNLRPFQAQMKTNDWSSFEVVDRSRQDRSKDVLMIGTQDYGNYFLHKCGELLLSKQTEVSTYKQRLPAGPILRAFIDRTRTVLKIMRMRNICLSMENSFSSQLILNHNFDIGDCTTTELISPIRSIWANESFLDVWKSSSLCPIPTITECDTIDTTDVNGTDITWTNQDDLGLKFPTKALLKFDFHLHGHDIPIRLVDMGAEMWTSTYGTSPRVIFLIDSVAFARQLFTDRSASHIVEKLFEVENIVPGLTSGSTSIFVVFTKTELLDKVLTVYRPRYGHLDYDLPDAGLIVGAIESYRYLCYLEASLLLAVCESQRSFSRFEILRGIFNCVNDSL